MKKSTKQKVIKDLKIRIRSSTQILKNKNLDLNLKNIYRNGKRYDKKLLKKLNHS